MESLSDGTGNRPSRSSCVWGGGGAGSEGAVGAVGAVGAADEETRTFRLKRATVCCVWGIVQNSGIYKPDLCAYRLCKTNVLLTPGNICFTPQIFVLNHISVYVAVTPPGTL
jgi:hypothetical protein